MKERYPKAQWLGNGRSGGSFIGAPWKLVLHTTETRSIPSYNFGFSAPHQTYYPLIRQWVQHTSFATAARALKRVSIQTNRSNALQVEIVCYSARAIAQRVGGLWVGDLGPEHLHDIASFIDWCGYEFGIRPRWPGRQAFDYAQANAPGFRMSASDWYSFHGVCGHQHVPTNTHWDPGALAWNKLFGGDDVIIRPGERGAYVRPWQEALNSWARKQSVPNWTVIAEDGDYGPNTVAAVSRYQSAAGLQSKPEVVLGQLDGLTRDLLERFVESA